MKSKKLTCIKKIIPGLILITNFSYLSYANTLSEDSRYENISENTVSIKDILEEDKVDISIVGETGIIKNDGSIGWVGTDRVLKSSFENNLITSNMIDLGEESIDNLGKYKAEIKITGKNILPNNFVRETGSGNGTNGNIYPSMFIYSSNRYRSKDLIKVKPETTYTIEGPAGFDYAVIEFDKSKKQLVDTSWIIKNSGQYTTSSKCEYMIIAVRRTDSVAAATDDAFIDEISDKIQIAENSSSTTYESYKENTIKLYLNSPLLKLDVIESINGKLNHIHNAKRITFDGSSDETIYTYKGSTDYIGFRCQINNIPLKAVPDYAFSNTFVNSPGNVYHSKGEGVWVTEGSVYIMMERSRLETEDVTGFKKWLSQNPTTVEYRLTNPTYEVIDGDLSIRLPLGTTHVINNSYVPTKMDVTIDRVANRTKDAVELVKTNPTIDNIAQARMWANLMKESVLKDGFQNETSSITDIKDLKIDNKTVSANSDVYIKMKNTLSLSLDTNSIIFDDVDSTQETELKNAVNLTVKSSLPYDIKASMESELYNNDKSAKLDKSVLNIKNSGSNTYQGFSEIGVPIMLLENQDAVESKIHSVDLRLDINSFKKADIYKTTLKFQVEQR